jgi:Carboxypeptidase regulatory-like domain
MRSLKVLLLFFVLCADLPAQTIRASIYGRVLDSSGGAVSGARVKVIHTDTNTTAFFVSDDLGNYDFPRLLQFGEYRLEVETPGFQKLIRSGIKLVIDQRAEIDLILQVGDLNQSVRVSTEAPLLETSNSTPGQFLSNQQILALPNLNRVPLSMVLLAPGVTPQGGSDGNPRPGTNSTSNFSVNGSRGVTNEMIVDGLSALVPEGGSGGSGTAGIVYSPNSEATEEIKSSATLSPPSTENPAALWSRPP